MGPITRPQITERMYMRWTKVLGKAGLGFITALCASIASDPVSIQELVGSEKALKVSAIVAIVIGVSNWYKNRKVGK